MTSRARPLTVVLALLALVAGAALPAMATIAPDSFSVESAGGPTPKPTPHPSPTPRPASVSIAGFAFVPGTLTVKKGTKVIWTNNQAGVPHTVSFTGGPSSATLSTGQKYSRTFTAVGTFLYHCNIHSTMHGTIKVTK